MARIINNQTNPWGRQNQIDIQRSDLWVVDFTNVLAGNTNLKTALANGTPITSGVAVPATPLTLATYFAQSVALPELKLKPESVRRDARPYQMPSWDEPLDPIRMVFLLDCFQTKGGVMSPYRSDLYQLLNAWRMCVRAGRNSMSSEFSMSLDATYRINYAFNVGINMLRPSSNPTASTTSVTTASNSIPSSISNDLEFSSQFQLVNCWLASFKIGELSYETAKPVPLEAVFYAEDILQQ